MLTPVDVQNKVFKGGIGFDKKDVENFMGELSSDYEMLYRSNVELKDKVAALNESLQHYKSVEDSMQKALTLSEKTAEETINAANDKARQLTTEAEKKAETILADAKQELLDTKNEIHRLQQQHKKFKAQFTQVLNAQLKIMDGEMIEIDLGPGFEDSSYQEGGFGNFSGGGLGSEGGLGGLGGGGGYVGSGAGGFERTNQDPAFDRGTLNMDPFADAMNGGGRFSRQTGGAYNGSNTSKKNNTKAKDNKSSLNVKNTAPGANKVKKNFGTSPSDAEPQSSSKPIHTASDTAKQKAGAVPPKKPAADAVTQTAATKVDTTAKPGAPDDTNTTTTSNTMASNSEAAAAPAREKVQPKAAPAGSTTAAKPEPPVQHAEEPVQVSGEVEDRVNESNMLDSEDNYSDGFDFVEEEAASAYDTPNTESSFQSYEAENSAASYDEDTVSGEVEDRINESTMLDSEDNYSDGFDFVSEDFGTEESTPSSDSSIAENMNTEEETYSGEVEDKINEATMLDSEDNYSDGFDFVVGNEAEEEIPTILSEGASFSEGLGGGLGGFDSTSSNDSGLNIDPFGENGEDDVFVGDVEDNVKQSNLIGNADDEEEGFNFL
ncbi:MAG: DivIVA domain-containing protein [Lachnospiraceae bacterium]